MGTRRKSSKNPPRQILGIISPTRAEQMLVEWVNTEVLAHSPRMRDAPADVPAWERLFRRYPEIPGVPLNRIVNEESAKRFIREMAMASSAAGYLRRAWDAPELRAFEWYTWKAQAWYEWNAAQSKHDVMPTRELGKLVEDDSPDRMIALLTKVPPVDVAKEVAKAVAASIEADQPPAVITPVEAAIFYLRHNRKRALHCPNPECPAPYFFATKKGQKYCSPECAKPAQREAKRTWWAEYRAKHKFK